MVLRPPDCIRGSSVSLTRQAHLTGMVCANALNFQWQLQDKPMLVKFHALISMGLGILKIVSAADLDFCAVNLVDNELRSPCCCCRNSSHTSLSNQDRPCYLYYASLFSIVPLAPAPVIIPQVEIRYIVILGACWESS